MKILSRILAPRGRTAKASIPTKASTPARPPSPDAAPSGRPSYPFPSALSEKPRTLVLDDLARPAMRVFTERDGLPINAVAELAFDTRGYLWAGTMDGAARYNGRDWTLFDMPDRMRSNRISALLSAADGSMWFGCKSQVVRLRDGAWTVYPLPSCPPGVGVECLAETREEDGTSVIWAGTEARLFRCRPERNRQAAFEAVPGPSLARVHCLLNPTGKPGALWAGTRAGVYRYEGGRWSALDAPGLPDAAVLCLLETEDDRGARTLWAGTQGEGLARLDAGRWTIYDAASGLPSARVLALDETRSAAGNRKLWVATYGGGLACLDERGFTVYGTSRGLPDIGVFALAQTRSGGVTQSLWASTDGGLARLELGQWNAFDTAAGLPQSGVYCFLETEGRDRRPVIWIGTNGGVSRFEDGAWETASTASGLPSNYVRSLLETRAPDGTPTVWVGAYGGLLASRDGDRWTTHEIAPDLAYRGVGAMLETVSAKGVRTLWAGTYDSGVVRLERGRWTVYGAASGVPSLFVDALVETGGERGTIWVGTRGGMARFERDRWVDRSAASGLEGMTTSGFLETADGDRRTLWVGMVNGGIAYSSAPDADAPWKRLSDSTVPALPNNSVYRLCQDDAGRVYAFTNKGVARLTRRAPTPDDPAEFDVYTFTVENGLPSNECNGGASMVDSRGRVWAGTARGAAVFDPSEEVEDRSPKPLYIERVLVNGAERPLLGGDVLTHAECNMTFEVALLSFFREGETRYRTQLAGFDPAPSDWTADHRVVYTNLPDGHYAFRVWGRDQAGNVSGPVELAFQIKPAPWKTWGAYALYAGAAAALGYAGAQYRERALRRRGEELEAQVSQRTAELAASEKQAVVAREEALQANRAKSLFLSNMSHELRTPLNAVLGFAQLMERSHALGPEDRENLGVIQRSGEHLLGLINDVLSLSKIEAGKLTLDRRPFELRPMLRAVEEMVRVRAGVKGLEVFVELDDRLPDVVLGDSKKLRQVLINLLGNAVKFTDRGTVRMTAFWAGGRGRFAVEDTGRGISEDDLPRLFQAFEQTESGQEAKEGTGLGLVISREIVRLMGGDIGVRSEPGVGTVFEFDVDLPRSDAPVERRERKRVVGLAPGQRAPRVLVVDDTAVNRMLLVKLLGGIL